MGTLADTLLEWKDFPRGLRVLLLDEDSEAAAQIKAKLEEFDYVVLTFSNEIEALAALESGTNAFHVALVEVTTGDGCGGFRFLENACDLPTIMVSNTNCLNTTMKCLALGAAEFLQKPVSEEKLKNIWQHVVHKAFSTHENVLSKSLKPVKTTVASMLKFLPGEAQVKSKSSQGGDSGQIIGEASDQRDTLHDVSVPTDPATQETITEPCNSERFAAPSTPQLEQGDRSASDKDHQDKSPRLDNSTNLKAETWDAVDNHVYKAFGEVKLDAEVTSGLSSQVESLLSVKKETKDMDGISLKRKITKEPGVKFDDMDNENMQKETPSSAAGLQSRAERVDGYVVNDSGIAEEEVDSAGDSKSEEDTSEKEAVLSSYVCNEENVDSSTEDTRGKKSNVDRACKKSSGSGKKKGKVEWTMDLHRRFLQAVEQLGVDQAIPSRILELMKVDGLTRHNVASHLQKYRSHRKHVMPRENEVAGRRSWQHFDPTWTRINQHGSWSQKGNPTSGPVLAYPHVQLQPTPLGTPVGPPLHVWGHPSTDQSSQQMWQKPSVGTPTTWQAQDGSFWKHPGVYVDAWGCPMPGMPWYPQPMVKLPSTTDVGSGRHVPLSGPAHSNGYPLWEKPIDVHPPKELIDEAIKEALKNPWMPLPLGLKPPSMESVIAELQKQGISKIPSPAL